MKEQVDNLVALLKLQPIEGCITGSVMLDYFDGADVDLFCYNEQSFIAMLYFMHYDKMFTILEPMELKKFTDFTKLGKSSLDSIGLVTIKFKYNLCIDCNVTFKKFHKNIFDVLSNFDMDIIATGYDIKTGKTLSLRETTGLEGTWNRWNTAFHKADLWSCKRLIRQFLRVIKYTERGYNLTSVTDKYISMIEEIINQENIYKTERGNDFYERTQKEFTVVLKILQIWKVEQKMTKEHQLILQTFI